MDKLESSSPKDALWQDVVKGIHSMKKEIEGKLHLLPLDREEETVNVLSLMLTQVQMSVLCTAIIHVPENFLDRNEIILNICFSFPPFLT